MAERPIVVSAQFVTGGDKDTVASVIGGVPGSTTGSGAQACGPITLADAVPVTTTNKLYNNGGRLTFNGVAIGNNILLASTNGTTTSAPAATLATFAFSATTTDPNHLNVNDQLLVYLSYYTTAAGSASGIWLRENGGAVDIWGDSGGGNNLGQSVNAWGETSVSLKLADIAGLRRVGSSGIVASATPTLFKAATMTIDWTGAWTLGLRFTGTAAGTVTWAWSVYRVLG